jgi:hypothetical protein
MGKDRVAGAANNADGTIDPWWPVPPPGQDASVSFEEIWRRCSHELLSGEGRVDAGAATPIYSLICRLPSAVATEAVGALFRHPCEWESHHRYAPDAVHTTILFLTPYLGIGAHTEKGEIAARIAAARGPIEEVLSRTSPLAVRAHGLNAFSSTVFLQLLQRVPDAPAAVRRGLADRLRAAFPRESADRYEAHLPWDLLWANLVRFRSPVSSEIVAAVEDERETDFGEVSLRAVELVRTDRLLSPARTEVLHRFQLGA